VSAQVYFDDIAEGEQIPSLKKPVTTVNILMYLGVVWLLDRIHFDYPFATERRGLPDIVAPGNMAVDFFAQFLTDWAGDKGALRKLSTQYRSFMVPGKTLECIGKITRKYREEGTGFAELDLTLQNDEGTTCVLGKALVELPIK